MKKFFEPTMSIQKFEQDDLLRTSGDCVIDALCCLKCYCAGVTCDGVYTCDGFVCSPGYEAD